MCKQSVTLPPMTIIYLPTTKHYLFDVPIKQNKSVNQSLENQKGRVREIGNGI